MLRHLIKLVGEHRIALGSDYPFPLGEHAPGSMIEQMSDLSDATKQRLLAGTALEFLGIDESRFSATMTGEVKHRNTGVSGATKRNYR